MQTEAERSLMYEAQVGRRSREYYLKNFARFDENAGRITPSWNWAAFLFSGPWALYRKMYGVFFTVVAAVALWELLAAGLRFPVVLGYAFYIALWIIFGLFGTALYYRHTTNKIERISATSSSVDQAAAELQLKGGVHMWVLPVFLLGPFLAGVLAGIVVPAYQDYTIRAQVSLGLHLATEAQNAIEMHYKATGVLPSDNASAGLPTAGRIAGDYVSSIQVDRGAIIITYGNKAHRSIHGHTLVLTFRLQSDGTLGWECGSQTIRAMNLPAACRVSL